MNIVMKDGRHLQGTALQIVKAMKELAFGVDHLSVTQYIDSVVEYAMRFEGAELTVIGETDEERSESLVSEMIRTELAQRA